MSRRPEVVLLFKAKHSRPKDETDFNAVLPYLDGKRRSWLRDALERVHPGHRWLAALGASAASRCGWFRVKRSETPH